MENHPIPQDVTGFQFRLIGDMTVKQFAYIAVGAVISAIFLFIIPINFFIKFPFIMLAGGSGLALAFLPMEGRPLDVMIFNFGKALFSPNQYIYQKMGGQLLISLPAQKLQVTQPAKTTSSAANLEMLLQTIHSQKKVDVDEKEAMFMQTVTSYNSAMQPQQTLSQRMPLPTLPTIEKSIPMAKPLPLPMQSPPNVLPPQPTSAPSPLHTQPASSPILMPSASSPITMTIESQHTAAQTPRNSSVEDKENFLQKQVTELKDALSQAKNEESHQKGNTFSTEAIHQKVLELERYLHTTLAQKQELENELVVLRKKQEPQHAPITTIASSAKTAVRESQTVKNLSTNGMAVKSGVLPTPDAPNLITGIIKDARDNVLPNILIEIKDKEGNSVRAFKTNTFGQFASATPLLNGMYTIEFEDPKAEQKFEGIKIGMIGKPVLPLEVISVDQREELRRQLFA